MRIWFALLFPFFTIPLVAAGNDDLPIVPEGFQVDVVAREPMVSNPCVMAFDKLGRICVAQGPQWRGPTPQTPGDRVDILLDDNADGIADSRQTFAEGFNSIQGIAWYGNDLWVANAPDLTVVRDTDGDDQADQYIRVYTGLGNLEHSLHGLNFGPDGKLYMSKGNSKGYNRLDQLAPKVFREMWGLPSPEGAPDYTPLEVFTKDTYQRKYHTPQDDWGQQGGILRCRPYEDDQLFAQDLEIISRGFRNPWDIAYDDHFNWLGTDNDQTQGDKIFAPFYGAHFGWGHPWSFHWTGKDHLPTVPASAPLFEGSGSGVIHYHASQFPEAYRNMFFVGDWMRREVYAFRPQWDGALMRCEGEFPPVFAHADGGRSLPSSSGRVFEPTDVEVGPDGALYVLSWGQAYGATIQDGKQVDAGRVYRIRYTDNPLAKWHSEHRQKPIPEWTFDQLLSDLGSDVPGWRVNAQNELLRRGDSAEQFLLEAWEDQSLSSSQQTWVLWTIGRFSKSDGTDDFLASIVSDANASRSSRIQAIRILAYRASEFDPTKPLPQVAKQLLASQDARLRHAAVDAIWQADQSQWNDDLVHLAAHETDRIVYYAVWNALRELASPQQRKEWLSDPRPGVRQAVLLGLFHDDAIDGEEATPFRQDPDAQVASLTNTWLEKTGKAEPLVRFDPPAGEYAGTIDVTISTPVPRAFLTYTLDGSLPTYTSSRVNGPIHIEQTGKLRVAVNRGNEGGSQYSAADYTLREVVHYRHRPFVTSPQSRTGRHYELDWEGLLPGKRHYTDRDYVIRQVPSELANLPFLRMANNDDRSSGEKFLSFDLLEPCDIIVGVDARNPEPLAWMNVNQADGFEDMELELATTDPIFRLYRKHFSPGTVTLGGNTNHPKTDTGRGHYLVIFDRQILPSPGPEKKVTLEDALAKFATADPERGRELFLHPHGAGCFKCHRMEGIGDVLAPDLSDIGSRAKTPQVLIESILEPSKVITEGFAQQQILTFDGKVVTGAVVEETGRSLSVVGSDAVLQVIDKQDIEARKGSHVSPMPSGFGEMMNAQQIADVAAWLMTQQVIGDRDGFSFKETQNQVDIYFANQRIGTYLKQHPKLTRRALVNVTTPSGIQVTRNFPPRKPEDIDPGYSAEEGIIHPVMHPGIWIGFGDVNGNDYWRLQSKVIFDSWEQPLQGDRNSGSFTARNRLMSQDGNQVVCTETTRYEFQRVDEGIVLRLSAEYRSDDHDFYFGDQEESGLAIRVASPIRVQGGGGTIVNDRGEINAAAMWGKPAKWFDYFATIDKRRVGLVVVSSSENTRPSWLHARDYGVVVTNPFPKQPKERREPYVKTWVKRGEPLHLSYTILIYDISPDDLAGHQHVIESFLGSGR